MAEITKIIKNNLKTEVYIKYIQKRKHLKVFFQIT